MPTLKRRKTEEGMTDWGEKLVERIKALRKKPMPQMPPDDFETFKNEMFADFEPPQSLASCATSANKAFQGPQSKHHEQEDFSGRYSDSDNETTASTDNSDHEETAGEEVEVVSNSVSTSESSGVAADGPDNFTTEDEEFVVRDSKYVRKDPQYVYLPTDDADDGPPRPIHLHEYVGSKEWVQIIVSAFFLFCVKISLLLSICAVGH